MIKEFFLDKFEYDFLSNKKWCEHLMKNEDELNDFIKRSMSHIINVHHIWIVRILEEKQESHTWDVLPIDYWIKLSQENYLKTIGYLEQLELKEKINYHDEEGIVISKDVVDVLYHILNHSNYHRAQISRELKRLELDAPSFNFISFH